MTKANAWDVIERWLAESTGRMLWRGADGNWVANEDCDREVAAPTIHDLETLLREELQT
jgi:hypothetical protein